jgi:hypothetical protein
LDRAAFSRGASRKAAPPPEGEAIEAAPEMRWLRMPPPLALNHIHLWRVDDGAGRAIVGTGINNQKTKESAALAMRADEPCRLAPAAVWLAKLCPKPLCRAELPGYCALKKSLTGVEQTSDMTPWGHLFLLKGGSYLPMRA